MSRLNEKQNINENSNLTQEQERLWFLKKLDRNYPDNCLVQFELLGEIQLALLQICISDTINRYAILRSNFLDISGKPTKKENQCSSVQFRILDNLTQSSFYDRILQQEMSHIFNYENEQLIRFTLLRYNKHRHVLLVNASLLILDKVSISLIVKNLFLNYFSYLRGDDDYKDYVIKPETTSFKIEQAWLKNKDLVNKSINFWRGYLDNYPSSEFLPDFIRPDIKNHSHNSISLTINGEKFGKIISFFNVHSYKINDALFCLFVILLARYTQQTDIIIGAKQNLREVFDDGVLGQITNTLVKRINVSDEHNYDSLLQLLSTLEQEISKHAHLPFGRLLQELPVKRELNRTPLFQIAYECNDLRQDLLMDPGLLIREIPNKGGRTDVDLAMNVTILKDELQLRMDFNASIYLKETINNFLRSFEVLFCSLLEKPANPIWTLPILREEDKIDILNESLQSRTNLYFEKKCIHHLFEEQADKTPGLPAIICQNELLTYQELDERSNQLARILLERNCDQRPIGIYLERSVHFVVAMLGILKAGSSYVPVDPEYPSERINHMLHDSQVSQVITQASLAKDLMNYRVHRLLLDTDWPVIEEFDKTRVEKNISPNSLAYIIYTSGSTGKPKAVLLRHKGVVNDIRWRQSTWSLTTDDRILQNSSFSFDPSVWATFWPISVGACSVITPPNSQNDVNLILELMRKQNISLIGTVPSMIAMLVANPEIQSCRALKYILSGGEKLSTELLKKITIQTGARVTNIYGPTEATINATSYECDGHDNKTTIPIGKPIRNHAVYLLDRFQQLVPQGARGEIYIGGIGVALGYYNKLELTKERFVPDPFINTPDARMYRTGDFGRLLMDGNIEFLGRVDHQVKLHGFRVELTEIEENILAHSDIVEAFVFLKKNIASDDVLVAYVVSKSGREITQKEMNAFLSINLPKYMLLNAVVCLTKLPKTVNGKVDMDALPPFTKNIKSKDSQSNQGVSTTQKMVAKTFEDVLGVENIASTDDFFELGGTSMMLTHLVTHLFNHFNLSIPLHLFFKIPTISGVTDIITTYQKKGLEAILLHQHVISLETDAVLDDDIALANLDYIVCTNPNYVLLSGVTGYLGTFLLEQILCRTTAKIYCLVRANSKEQGIIRIKQAMSQYGIWKEIYLERILPVIGDLAKGKLGLLDDEWNQLAKKIDIIYHNGALVNFAYPYSALRGPNVLGTKELLRLACSYRIKAFHYVSTIDVLLAAHCSRPFIENDAPIKAFSNIQGGYTGSKWVAEKLVYAAQKKGLPVSIYRPGLIMGHTKTGATQENDYLLVAFRGFLPMGIMPEYKRIFDVVPVDYVAKSIVAISLHEGSVGQFYHLFNPAPVSLHQFLEWTRTYGYKFEIVPFDVAREKAIMVNSDNPLYPLIPLIRDADPEPHITLDPRFIHELQPESECKNSLTILKQYGITCPEMSESLTHLCLDFLVKIGFFPNPCHLDTTKETNIKEMAENS